ncbi:MAG: hypothetical protein QM767_09710 [Anaeromyxobacter sp.]
MKPSTLLLPLAALAVLTGCPRLDPMQRQQKYKAYQASEFHSDGLATRAPPEGTVPYGVPLEPAVATGRGPDGKPVALSPVPVDEKLLARGRSRFDIHCAVCHGVLGDGESQLAMNMSLRRPPSLHLYRDVPDGHIYQVISEGFGLMGIVRPGAVGAGPVGGGRLRPRAAAEPARAGGQAAAGGAREAGSGDAMTLTPFQGGRTLMVRAGAVGVVALALTAVGGFLSPQRALYAYLVAFVYWLGIALGALILLGAFHASNARWPVVLRRFLEHLPAAVPLFAVLFIPIVWGMNHLFPWIHPEALAGELRHAAEHKAPYLNVPFFIGRAVFYFLCWFVIGHLLRAWSIRQDQQGGVTLTKWQRRLGAGALPLLALTLTFAAFDWLMSIDPRFFSTIFGVYWFAGSFVATFAVTILAGTATRNDLTQFGAHMSAEHFHSLGKFLLAFTAFWAYVAFSQFLLIWIANVPEEVPWYILRTNGGWLWVAVFLAALHFVVPFFLLLSRDRKRDPRRLSRVALWLLFVHWVNLLLAGHAPPRRGRPALLAVGRDGLRGRGRGGHRLRRGADARDGGRPGPRPLPRGLAEVPAAMSTHSEHDTHGHAVRAEPDVVNTTAILAVGLGSLVVFFIASLAAVGYYRYKGADYVPPPMPAEMGQSKIGLVEQQLFDLTVRGQNQRALQLKQLGSYGWVDRQAGLAHIPIEDAMALVAGGVRPGVVPPDAASSPGAQP